MPNVTNQVRLRTRLELKHPASKQAALLNRQAGHMGYLQAHPSQANHVPSGSSSPLLIHSPLPQSSLQKALPRTLGHGTLSLPLSRHKA